MMSAPDAELARSMDDLYVREFLRQTLDNFSGSVGRCVVAKKNVGPQLKRGQLATKPLDVLSFVVGRNENEKLRRFHESFLLLERGWTQAF